MAILSRRYATAVIANNRPGNWVAQTKMIKGAYHKYLGHKYMPQQKRIDKARKTLFDKLPKGFAASHKTF